MKELYMLPHYQEYAKNPREKGIVEFAKSSYLKHLLDVVNYVLEDKSEHMVPALIGKMDDAVLSYYAANPDIDTGIVMAVVDNRSIMRDSNGDIVNRRNSQFPQIDLATPQMQLSLLIAPYQVDAYTHSVEHVFNRSRSAWVGMRAEEISISPISRTLQQKLVGEPMSIRLSQDGGVEIKHGDENIIDRGASHKAAKYHNVLYSALIKALGR